MLQSKMLNTKDSGTKFGEHFVPKLEINHLKNWVLLL